MNSIESFLLVAAAIACVLYLGYVLGKQSTSEDDPYHQQSDDSTSNDKQEVYKEGNKDKDKTTLLIGTHKTVNLTEPSPEKSRIDAAMRELFASVAAAKGTEERKASHQTALKVRIVIAVVAILAAMLIPMVLDTIETYQRVMSL